MSIVELEPGAPGTRMLVPASVSIADLDRRLALAVARTDADLFLTNGARQKYLMTPGAADFSTVNAFRCQVREEHQIGLEFVLGRVEAAWIENNQMRAILRFGQTPRAQIAWSLIADNIPVSISTGMSILRSAPVAEDDGRVFLNVVERWRLDEISVCASGKDPEAWINTANHQKFRDELEALAERKRYEAEAVRRDAVFEEIRALRWGLWASDAGAAIARKVGADEAATTDALKAEVDKHIAALLEPPAVSD